MVSFSMCLRPAYPSRHSTHFRYEPKCQVEYYSRTTKHYVIHMLQTFSPTHKFKEGLIKYAGE